MASVFAQYASPDGHGRNDAREGDHAQGEHPDDELVGLVLTPVVVGYETKLGPEYLGICAYAFSDGLIFVH